mmetsp:Transcript_7334/g.10490  ORF Transcript_7334/g.10490 Transcript_7334/m.10490 type:complete len:91 (-) Transcript_7334:239-511(-)
MIMKFMMEWDWSYTIHDFLFLTYFSSSSTLLTHVDRFHNHLEESHVFNQRNKHLALTTIFNFRKSLLLDVAKIFVLRLQTLSIFFHHQQT